MRKALALSLLAIFLGGCASDPADRDISGTWINQVAIDAAAKGGPLREALQAYGPNLEWDVNTKAGQARYTNGFENVEGRLQGEQSGAWKVDFYGSSGSELKRDGGRMNKPPPRTNPTSCSTAHKSPYRKARQSVPASNAHCIRLTWAAAGRLPAATAKATPCNSRPTARCPACPAPTVMRCAWQATAPR